MDSPTTTNSTKQVFWNRGTNILEKLAAHENCWPSKLCHGCCGKGGCHISHGHLNISHAFYMPTLSIGLVSPYFVHQQLWSGNTRKTRCETVFHSTRRKEFVRIFSSQVQIQEAAASSGSRTPFSKPKESGLNSANMKNRKKNR